MADVDMADAADVAETADGDDVRREAAHFCLAGLDAQCCCCCSVNSYFLKSFSLLIQRYSLYFGRNDYYRSKWIPKLPVEHRHALKSKNGMPLPCGVGIFVPIR